MTEPASDPVPVSPSLPAAPVSPTTPPDASQAASPTASSNGPAASLAPVTPPVPPVGEPLGHQQTIDEVLLEPRPRNWKLPLLLFIATCVTTFFAGVYHWNAAPLTFGADTWRQVQENWPSGLVYMLCVIGILLAHEMGHFLATVRYHVPASYPIFIPFPLLWTGTMGAVIGMDGARADRKQIFDIGLAGPLAGLVVAVPVLIAGVMYGDVLVPPAYAQISGDPLLAELLIRWLHPDAPVGSEIVVNPLYMAGWVGMLITGLNMMPISQLDGGHVLYALFGRHARTFARWFLVAVIAWMVLTDNYRWVLMVIIVTVIGADHPPTANDEVPLGRGRQILGIASLAIPIFCFIPNPM